MGVEIIINENKYIAELSQNVTEITAEIQTGYFPIPEGGGGGGSVQWGGITGDLENQTDLKEALDNRIPLTGTEEGMPITGDLEIVLDGNNYRIFSRNGDSYWGFNINDSDSGLVHYNSDIEKKSRVFLQRSLHVESEDMSSEGIISTTDFSERSPENKLIYAQRSYVDNKVWDYVQFNTSATNTYQLGKVYWNEDKGTYNFGLKNGVELQLGQEQHVYGKAYSNISNGQLVMYRTSQGGHVLFEPANFTTISENPDLLIGLATQDIATNEFGYITTFGEVNTLNTSSFLDGDTLYFGSGNVLTKVQPSGSYFIIGRVNRAHSTQGSIFVKPYFKQEIGGVTKTSFTHNILVGDWSLVSGKYEAVISNAAILADSFVDVIPSNDSTDIVRSAQVFPSILISSGSVKVYSKFLPSSTISVTVNII